MADAVTPMKSVGSSGSQGGIVSNLWQVFLNEPVSAAATVDSIFTAQSVGIDLSEFTTFGFYGVLTGATPDVRITVLQSYTNVAATFALPDVGGTVIQIVDTNIHQVTVSPTPMPWIRFRAVGGAGNGADVVLSAWAWFRSS